MIEAVSEVEARGVADAHLSAGAALDGPGGAPLPPHWSKPLLRGRIHAVACIGALVLVALIATHAPPPHGRLALLAYGASLVELYGVSAVFHIGPWRGKLYQYVKLLDHASIFASIAATATAFVALAPLNALRLALIALIWAMAGAGVSL